MATGGDMEDDNNWAGKGFSVPEIGSTAACPSCGALAETEQEDDVLFFACECGHYFGYRTVKHEEEPTCAAGIPLGHLAMLGGLTGAETDRLVYDGKPPRPASAVFLGSIIHMRPEG